LEDGLYSNAKLRKKPHPNPVSKGEGLNYFFVDVLSFGEDLGEAIPGPLLWRGFR
jgi:hypothetical protein